MIHGCKIVILCVNLLYLRKRILVSLIEPNSLLTLLLVAEVAEVAKRSGDSRGIQKKLNLLPVIGLSIVVIITQEMS